MENNSKRRKIEYGGSGLRKDALIDFQSRNSARVSSTSTFMLQTDELLKQTKVDTGSAFKSLTEQLHSLKGIIDAIEPHGPIPIAEATAKFEKKHKIAIPYPEPKPSKESPYKVSFSPPSQCNVVGSYVAGTIIKSQPRIAVDMVIQMPKSLFQDKDYLDMRYFYRRAYYIAYIASVLHKELSETMDARFELLHENPLLPIITLRPKTADGAKEKKKSKKLQAGIRVIPCAPDDLFPWSKLSPQSSNIRSEETDEKKTQTATPFYNSTLNAERTFIQYLRVLTNAKKECSAFTDACILGRVWLQQRGFGSSISQGGFGHFEWSVMTALLLKMGGKSGQAALSTSLSSTELFKAAIQFLSTTDFNKKAFAFGAAKANPEGIKETGPVMYDPTRQLNVLFKMSSWSASLLQLHAKSTTTLLADEAADKFDPTFIAKVDVPLQIFDAILTIQCPAAFQAKKQADRNGTLAAFGSDVCRILKKAYGNRSQLVHIQLPEKKSWKLSGHPAKQSQTITVGIIFELTHMTRQMEHGPPAEEQKEAAKFRQFWGEKAELRRFKDGSILECVEWSGRSALQICEEIAQYSLQRHLKTASSDVEVHGDGLASVLTLSNMDKEAFDAARRNFQTLEHDIRGLDDLPLQIRQLSPVSPLARYASIQPPLVGFHQDTITPMDVNLYFEASSKWPENLTAIQEAKFEFLIDLDRRLTTANDTIATYLGRENLDVGIENMAYLDIIYETGAAFRLRIHCDLEDTILERQVKNKLLDPRTREAAEDALANAVWQFTILPVHTQTIATFSTRLQALSPTIRLVKHWFASHKLSPHISPELIELFVLHAFLQPYPWTIPSSVTTGFLRTLSFLSKWDWREQPLILDTADQLTTSDRHAVQAELDGWRKRDPGMNSTVLIVATSHDQSGLAYTRDSPSKILASRMTRLAKAACKLVREQGIDLEPFALFEPALQDYDVLIHLSTKVIGSIVREAASDSHAKKPSQFKNLDDRTGKMPLPIRASPADVLVGELQRAFDDTLIFFPGGVDDDSIVAALWNPRLQQQKFRPGLPYNFHQADGDGDLVEVNRKAVLLEIARAGGSLIKKIEELNEE